MSHVQQTIEVDVPVRVAYNQWTQFEDFPEFMGGVDEVRQIDDTHLHWVASIAGVRREWDAQIVEQTPDRCVSWANTDGVVNSGTVTFDPVAPTSTRVTLDLDFEPEGIVENVGDKLGFVAGQAKADLERFREFITTRGAATGAWRGEVHDGQQTSTDPMSDEPTPRSVYGTPVTDGLIPDEGPFGDSMIDEETGSDDPYAR